MKYISIIFLFFAIAPLVMKCSFNVGNLGLLILSGCFYLLEIHVMEPIIIVLLIIVGIVFLVNSYRMLKAIQTKPKGDETVIVLGCGVYGAKPSLALIERMNEAIQFMNQHKNVKCIVSGGQGRLEDISEALAMYTYMTNEGIETDRIYQEDKSRNTDENICFSKRIIEEKKLNPSITLITQNYHMYRAMRIAKKYGFNCSGITAKSRWYATPAYWLREVVAILYIDTMEYLKK